MVGVPAVMPVTRPVVLPTLTALLAVLHAPLPVSVSVSELPWHILPVPPIVPGNGFTVMVIDVVHPVPVEKVTVAVPAVEPVTRPVVPMITLPVPGVALHVPVPPAASMMLEPIHTCVGPLIRPAPLFTVTVFVAAQPVPERV